MKKIIRHNERSHVIDIISYINILIKKYDLSIKHAGGEKTIMANKKAMFPDLILYSDTEFLQGWEAKMPDTPITDEIFINDAARKAKHLGVNSFIIWNFSSARFYVRYNEDWKIEKTWSDTNHIKTREDVETYQNDWKKLLLEIILFVNSYFITGKVKKARIEKAITDSVISNLIENNKENVSNSIKDYVINDTSARAFIQRWWYTAKNEFSGDETDSYVAYAKMLMLNWSNKILFANLVKSHLNSARLVETIDENTNINEAIDIFKEITEKNDFYNIFGKVEYGELLDKDAWIDIVSFNTFLQENDLSAFSQKNIQDILESSIKVSKRVMSGQYTTPKTLAEILCKLAMTNLRESFYDGCCGTGTIVKEGLEIKKEFLSSDLAISNTWASDKDSFPLQLASLTLSSIETFKKPLLTFKYNVLSLRAGQQVKIIDPETGEKLKYNLPEMGTICSNLPFVSGNKISEEDKELLSEINSQIFEKFKVKLSGKSDLYMYIPFQYFNLLSNNGRLGLITSNSWLGTASGRIFFEVLRHYFIIEQLHLSGKGRWFKNADIVAVILILQKRNFLEDSHESTRFYLWNNSLEEFSDNDDLREDLINSALLAQEPLLNTSFLSKYSSSNINQLLALNISINSLFHSPKWMLAFKNSLVKLTEVFDVIRGSRRGWDKMFFPQDSNNIEKKYLKPVLMNTQNVKHLEAKPNRVAFCCSETLQELKLMKDHGALEWILKFESETNTIGKPLKEVLSKSGMHWYELRQNEMVDIFTTMNPGKRLFYGFFEDKTFINQRLIGLIIKNKSIDRKLLQALLNSIVSLFYIEATGFGRGLGALDISKNNIEKNYMLNPGILSTKDIDDIKKAFDPLLLREIKDLEEELEQEDREHFDRTVLRAYGLEHYYSQIKKSLKSMYDIRNLNT